MARDRGRVRPERARAQADVARLHGHVADGRVVHGDAQRAQLTGRGQPGGLGQGDIIGRAQGHGTGEARGVVAQADQLAALLVGRR